MKKLIPIFLVINGCASTPKTSDFETKAAEFLSQYNEACADEKGGTWQHSLCVPMIIVDSSNLAAVSTDPDPDGQFENFGEVYRGKYNGSPLYANTSVKWGGRNWSMVVWPLPDDINQRIRLMFHEAFHSVQEELGLPMNAALNTHLDKEEARVLIRLEWNALLRALENPVNAKKHLEVALQMRNLRFKKYPNAQKNEESMEMNEGVAEYTGLKLSGYTPKQMIEILHKKVEGVPDIFSLTRSSAYYSGPLYGLLLDTKDPQWKSIVSKERSFGKLASAVFHVKPIAISDAELRNYGSEEIVKYEHKRAQEIKLKIANYLEQINQPGKLELVLKNPQAVFNPYGILSIDANTLIYETYEVRDQWGLLKVEEGTLFKFQDGQASIAVSPPAKHTDSSAQGQGWELKLAPGWKLIRDKTRFSAVKL